MTTVAMAITVLVAIGGAAAQAAPSPDHRHVTSVVHNPDGTLTEVSYSPAPGVTPHELARRLKAQGVPNVSVAGEDSEITPMVAQCAYGTAWTWASDTACFVRWSYNGYTRPQLYFLDYSSSAWPVGRAVSEWNKTSGIDSIYHNSSGGCGPSGTHCIRVYSSNYGNNGWTGRTYRTYNAAQTYDHGADTYFNDYYGGTETERWGTSCHELGHVLGLDHNTSTGSCLYYTRAAGRSKYPHSDDYTLLERYY